MLSHDDDNHDGDEGDKLRAPSSVRCKTSGVEVPRNLQSNSSKRLACNSDGPAEHPHLEEVHHNVQRIAGPAVKQMSQEGSATSRLSVKQLQLALACGCSSIVH